MTQFSAIILAAGKGTRMKSFMPKPLHKLAGKPMLGYVIDTYKAAGAAEIIVVISPDDNKTPELFPDVIYAVQAEPKGTGHAASIGLAALIKPVDKVIVAIGDQPFITLDLIESLLRQNHAVTVVAMRPDDPARYGRLITDDSGFLLRIVEYKDASEIERKINLCSAYPIGLDSRYAKEIVSKIKPENAASEYYFTDVVKIANEMHYKCGFIETPVLNAAAANTREELAALESIIQKRLRKQAMDNGATLIDPDTVYFSYDAQIGNDVIIEPNVFFGPAVVVEDNVYIKSFCHIEGTTVKAQATIGPFARLRQDTVIGAHAQIGNFVEINRTAIGESVKIKHLSYIGHAKIGDKTIIGAGTITCTFDGFKVQMTAIGKDAFIGSHSTIVAPVTVGDGAMTAAGSVITQDVKPDSMAIARSRQTDKPGWAAAFRSKRQKTKA